MEEYNEDRGFLLTPYEEWTPGPKVFDQISLQSEILAYETNHSYYQKARKQVTNKIHAYQDGNSSERVWKFVTKLYLSRKSN